MVLDIAVSLPKLLSVDVALVIDADLHGLPVFHGGPAPHASLVLLKCAHAGESLALDAGFRLGRGKAVRPFDGQIRIVAAIRLYGGILWAGLCGGLSECGGAKKAHGCRSPN